MERERDFSRNLDDCMGLAGTHGGGVSFPPIVRIQFSTTTRVGYYQELVAVSLLRFSTWLERVRRDFIASQRDLHVCNCASADVTRTNGQAARNHFGRTE